ncbi:hypothetical protein [Ekhidna sp.]|jgi:glycosyltransferase involved in cell wall biosynthesis|uniref:hypothetical protein n=1 Tax=Ekhidna sp. TaxID=2608089 RepID=UPI0032EB3CEA
MKKKIVIASVLKPIDDVRAYWKLSQSIAKTNKYEVNIIGNVSKKEPSYENIKFHSHPIRGSQWIKRWFLRLKIMFKVLRIKPDILIITTHELITVSLLARLLIHCKVVYDVQENYYLNLIGINPNTLKKIYANLVRLKEKFSRIFISEYWLAEKCYSKQLSFVKSKNEVIENKAYEVAIERNANKEIQVLYSGTISHYGGIDRAIIFYKELVKSEPDASLKIVGQVHDTKLKLKLENEANKLPNLSLHISYDPIPHPEIIQAISNASVGVIGYTPNRINGGKIPTKLYEYSRYRLPYLVEQNTPWSTIGESIGGAIPVDFNDISIEKTLKILRNPDRLFKNAYPKNATWEHESSRILTSLNRLTNNN